MSWPVAYPASWTVRLTANHIRQQLPLIQRPSVFFWSFQVQGWNNLSLRGRRLRWRRRGVSSLKKGWRSCTHHKYLLSYSNAVLDFSTSARLVLQGNFKAFFRRGDGGRKSFVAHSLCLEQQPKLFSKSQKSSGAAWLIAHNPVSISHHIDVYHSYGSAEIAFCSCLLIYFSRISTTKPLIPMISLHNK